jgi:hypothetical protein
VISGREKQTIRILLSGWRYRVFSIFLIFGGVLLVLTIKNKPQEPDCHVTTSEVWTADFCRIEQASNRRERLVFLSASAGCFVIAGAGLIMLRRHVKSLAL